MLEGEADCRLRVIGIGSPFGADRVAWDVIDMLNARPLPRGVEARCCIHPLSELPQLMRDAKAVFLVDAMIGVDVGEVVRCTRAELGERGAALSSHGLSVDLALDLAAALGEMPCSLEIFGLGIGAADSTGPDQGLAAALPGFVATLRAAIQGELDGATNGPPPDGAIGYGEVRT